MADESEFTLRGADDFVRLDQRCLELLREFFAWLQEPGGGRAEPQHAARLAHAADRYLRDFVVDIMETGPADADPTLPSRYLANWYVIHTLEPTHAELDLIREALSRLYPFLTQREIVPAQTSEAVLGALADGEFFRARLEAFWELTPDAIAAWRAVHDYRRRSSGPAS